MIHFFCEFSFKPEMNFTRKTTLFLFTITSVFILNQCYLPKQGLYLIRYNSTAEDIDVILKDKNLADENRNILTLIREIKEYSVTSIGLQNDKSYTKYVEIDKGYLVDVVSACEKDRFEPYTWKFPFFGSFPYKGFYEQQDAENEAEMLRRKDLDVMIRQVDAFSTLGFFSDPVYSFMKDYSVYSMASLIIHEQTHATIFLKNQIQFNEELATFIGNEGALQFVRDKYGTDSEYYTNLLNYREDLDTYFTLFRCLYDELNAVYEKDVSREYKLERKEEIFRSFKGRIIAEYNTLFKTDSFKNIEKIQLNNAYVLSINRYTGGLSLFYELYEKMDHDLRKTVDVLKQLNKHRGDPREFIRESLEYGNG